MDLSNLTIRNLEYVVAVAEEGHFGRAALKCNVSQPALSAQIHKLERSLGTSLFDRSGRSVRTTPNGEELIEHARCVLDEVKSLAAVADRATNPLSGSFRLGVIATLGAYLLPHLLSPLKRSFPLLELVLTEGLTDSLLDQLRLGRLDAVLASLPLTHGSFRFDALFSEPFYLAVPAGHRLSRTRRLTPNMLLPQEMILLEDGHCLRDQALEVCPAQDRSLRERFRATSLETLRHMVASGIGYTLIPALAVPQHGELAELIEYRRFDETPPSRIIGMVARYGSAASNDAHELSAFIRENLPAAVVPAAVRRTGRTTTSG